MQRPQSSVPGPRPQAPDRCPRGAARPAQTRGVAQLAQERAAARLAFTLLELLIAIAIIAILATLILTVAGAASKRAHDAQVVGDIQSLATGISAFKQRFGVEPPSSITLYEQGSSLTPGAGWNNDPRSMGLIRQIWPQFDFNYGNETAYANAVDINGNGNATDTITLSGAECLVFFLGGMPALQANAAGIHPPTGFSKNPVDPFSRTGTSNRESFTEFDASRLYLFQAGGTAHTMNTYADNYGHPGQPTSPVNPYLYLSSYNGQGYNIAELVGSPALASNAPGGTFIDVYRPGSQGYWQPTSATQPESGLSLTQNTGSVTAPWNPNSYQIIAPGGDQLYGIGGEYETGNGTNLLIVWTGATPAQNVDRTGERDNITNFSSGVLAP
jgi:prepilin-type N-terminal cleavage/methylation domain-containing protein